MFQSLSFRIWEALCRLSWRDIRSLWPTQTWQQPGYFLKESKQRASCSNRAGRAFIPQSQPLTVLRGAGQTQRRGLGSAEMPDHPSRWGGPRKWIQGWGLGSGHWAGPQWWGSVKPEQQVPGLAPGSRDPVAEPDQHLQPSLMGLSLNRAPRPMGADGGPRWSFWRFIRAYSCPWGSGTVGNTLFKYNLTTNNSLTVLLFHGF